MDLLEHLFSNLLYTEPIYVRTLYDQNFGLGLSLPDLRQLNRTSTLPESYKALMNPSGRFKVSIDIQHFKPQELTVKVVNNYVEVEGKHEERCDEHGFVSRQFKRRYLLPKGVDETQLISTLTRDGVLQLTAPKKASQKMGERNIPITETNMPAMKPQTTAQDQEKPVEKK